VIYTELEGNMLEEHLGADTSLLHSDRSTAIIKLIQELSTVQQMVFNMKAIDGFSFAEIAAQVGTNEATLRSHYLRARKKLQSLLRKELEKNG